MEKSDDQKNYEKFMAGYVDYMMEEEDFDSFYAYGPLTNKYWTFKPRILVCNLEPYDEREGFVKVNIDLYKEWIKVNTGKNSARFITGLTKKLNKDNLNESIRFDNLSILELLNHMENVAYMNFRISSGRIVNADIKNILNEVQTFKGYLVSQIKLLSPNIIIIGGVEGCRAFNLLFEADLNFNTTIEFDSKVISSIKHPSRADYKYYNEKVIEILNCYQVIQKKYINELITF